jgi:hypothetical protein
VRTLALFALLQLCLPAQHKQHKHEHGKAELAIAVDGLQLEAELEAPAESILGFEHLPRTADEKRKQEAAFARLRNQAGSLILLPAAFGCVFQAGDVHTHDDPNSGHRDVHATFRAVCKQPPKQGEVRFAFSKHFPALKELAVQLVAEQHQTAAKIVNDQGSLRLGP